MTIEIQKRGKTEEERSPDDEPRRTPPPIDDQFNLAPDAVRNRARDTSGRAIGIDASRAWCFFAGQRDRGRPRSTSVRDRHSSPPAAGSENAAGGNCRQGVWLWPADRPSFREVLTLVQ